MIYEKLFRHALFPMYESVVRRRATAAHMREYRKGQWLSSSELAALQLRKLNELLAFCWAEVPFLQQHWTAAGCKPAALGDVSELARYPVLTKSDITAHYADMVARPWRGRTLAKSTSGSTGEPFRFEYTMQAYARRTAVMWRGYDWAGAGLGTRTAYLWGTGMRTHGWGAIKDRLYHGAFNRHFFDALSLDEPRMDQTIAAMHAYRPDAVVGYVSPLITVARRINATDKRMHGLRGVLTGAEALLESERREIEAAFGAPVFNTYGSREVMLMAAECPTHEGLHVNSDHLVLETLDDANQPVAAGVSGNVAVTDLHNYGMPMVRYLNGDRATYAAARCSCGRALPLLTSIDGRVLDLITTPDGRQVPGEFFSIVMNPVTQVRQWQVAQTARDRLEMRLIPAAGWSDALSRQVLDQLSSKLGPSMHVSVMPVDHIEPAASGKRRLTIALPRETGMV